MKQKILFIGACILFLLVYLQLFKKPLEIEGVQHFVNARRHKCV